MLSEIIIISLAILGLHYAMSFDMIMDENGKPIIINKNILWFVKYYLLVLTKKFKVKILIRPLCECVICMSSMWGTIGYLLLNTNYTLTGWGVTVVAVAGLNRLLISIIQNR